MKRLSVLVGLLVLVSLAPAQQAEFKVEVE